MTVTSAVTGPAVASLPDGLDALAVVLARGGELPAGAAEAVTEAGGAVLVAGDGAEQAAARLAGRAPRRAWFCETGSGLRPGRAGGAAGPGAGRGAADRAAGLRRTGGTWRPAWPRGSAGRCWPGPARPAWSRAGRVSRLSCAGWTTGSSLPVQVAGPAVVTLAPGTGIIGPPLAGPGRGGPAGPSGVARGPVRGADQPGAADPQVLAVIDPDPAAMDLAEAALVFGGGAGLAAGLDAGAARAVFDLLTRVAAAAGAAAGATRVATDAGWAGLRPADRHHRRDDHAPALYVAFGISGAVQHTGGLGEPEHVVSVNTDPSCPMTAMADLGLVADARGTAGRRWPGELGVEVRPEEVTPDAG